MPVTPPRKSLYLANPYGFSAQQRRGPLVDLVGALEALGAEVWEPFARNNQGDLSTPEGVYRVGQGRRERRTQRPWVLRRRQRLPAGRRRHGGTRFGDRLAEACLPLPGRLPAVRRQRHLPAKPDGVHRAPAGGMACALVRIGGGAGRPGQGAGALAERHTLTPGLTVNVICTERHNSGERKRKDQTI